MPSAQCRILVADGSTVTRRMLTELLAAEPGLEIVGAAANGEEAVAFFRALKPDIVLLDVEMPVMSGIEALRAIRVISRTVPVIMFSTLTVRGGEATLDALMSGATDFAARPSGVDHVSQVMEYLQATLVPRIVLWGTRYMQTQSRAVALRTGSVPAPEAPRTAGAANSVEAVSCAPTPNLSSPLRPAPRADRHVAVAGSAARRRRGVVSVVAIGSSTGSTSSLADVISRLPADINVPIVIAQHMPRVFTPLLADRLNRNSRLTVMEGTDGAELFPGGVFVAPGDYHMRVVRQGPRVVLRMSQDAPVNSCRPAVDVMFRSVAEVYGAAALAVVLTGMGKDGLEGCRQLQTRGAGLIAQDETTSVVGGMPRAVAEAGLADAVLPVSEIPAAITARIRASQSYALSGTTA